jgi:tetratricopeptide (TPR) repeat protein
MRYVWLAALLALAGCASAPIKPQDVPRLAQADARVLDGCYDCLIEARDTYNKVAVGKARPLLITKLFETQLLIALREKELSLDSSLAFARARELAREMPPLAEAGRYLALAEQVPPEPRGTPQRELRAYHAARAGAYTPTVQDELDWLRSATSLNEYVRQYLSLAVDCGYIGRGRRPGGLQAPASEWVASLSKTDLFNSPPLVAYRAAICETLEPKAFNRVHQVIPEFAEAALYLARIETAQVQETGGFKAREYLAEVEKRFPESLAVHHAAGQIYQLANECEIAIGHYDKLLAAKPAHDDGLIGRAACLSFLKRHTEAIDQATTAIDLRIDLIGTAFYWRAWNYHALKQLDQAQLDVDRAKAVNRDELTLTLAGIIEYERDALPAAFSDLTNARRQDRTTMNCTARWYLGLVGIKQEQWVESSKAFEDAMGCYTRLSQELENRLSAVRDRTDLDAAWRAKQLAFYEAGLKTSRSQFHASAFNTANQAAQSGDAERAKRFLEIAALDPELATPVGQLREILTRAGGR